MKAVLTLDMPENCVVCPMVVDDEDELAVGEAECKITGKWTNELYERPKYCPLRELPEKKPEKVRNFKRGTDLTYNHGWNSCRDAITGGATDE